MPTYEYACASCGHEFEQFQSMKDAPLQLCPACKKKKLKRLVGGGAGLIFKGSGFYITDYKKKSGGEPKAAESKTAESKPAEAKPASSDPKKTSTPAPTAAPKASTSSAKK